MSNAPGPAFGLQVVNETGGIVRAVCAYKLVNSHALLLVPGQILGATARVAPSALPGADPQRAFMSLPSLPVLHCLELCAAALLP